MGTLWTSLFDRKNPKNHRIRSGLFPMRTFRSRNMRSNFRKHP
ncbi:hypothetical protein LEP1GSC188_2049 [Leptospira weilii serovar Topaz str. LT2116]|uniref:Uncharacterized protein n=1 Tax=Leptospira weilii serovar Topaz str. LT2116 TaxID=1088540 RepID=M3H2J2_9LEPT|nr:hypothetical protein LEP1GSC188_2049 [Leptospira weilii serovar Topaz str. LT2116]